MKLLFLLFSLIIGLLKVNAQNNLSALLPLPNHIVQQKGKPFHFTEEKTRIHANHPDLKFAATYLQAILAEELEFLPTVSADSSSAIQLLLDKRITGEEHYLLEISSHSIRIKGATSKAIFYGIQTLHQLILGDPCSTHQKEILPIRIDDAPRFSYRALMIDPARHFIPVQDVKFYIDQMVRYKYNVLQLHLTDDQGWRVEIKSHPELASKQHYSQTELTDLIHYAADRHVEIVPELDIPGHTVAILAAYPELGCTVSDTIKKDVEKTTNLMLCASVDKVYQIYKDIFREMAAVFPSKLIHLGGDESAIEKNWALCDRCKKVMKAKGYTQASQLMIPFFNNMLTIIRDLGKSPILWCELDKIYPPANEYLFPYPNDVTLVTWRNGLTPKCIELTRQHGNPLIMAPGEYTYFDYPQLKGDLPEFNNWGMPITTLEKTYSFDPGYGLSEKDQRHIKGVMGTLWGEAMLDINRVTYMTYPRALALAEAGWTQLNLRNWESFKKRMYPNLYLLMKKGVSIRIPFEIVDRR